MDPGPTTTDARSTFCMCCGVRLSPGAQFCYRCGTRAGEAPVPSRRAPSKLALPWAIAALVLIAIVSLLAGQYFGRQSADAAIPGPPSAPDISSMSPEPTHLLGLILAAGAADARALPEYVTHAEEIESALARARRTR